MEMSRSELTQLLLENSAQKYHVEFRGFIYNHATQGIVALTRLGASPQRIQSLQERYISKLNWYVLVGGVGETKDERALIIPQTIMRFLEWYIPRLEPADKHISAENEDNIELEKLLGARKSFYALNDIYEQELASYDGSLERLIVAKLPLIGRGLAGSALHGIIQVGYGYSARSDIMVYEGLAYMHMTYVAPELSEDNPGAPAIPDCDLFDVFNKVRDDVTLTPLIHNEILKPEWQSNNISDLQRSVAILMKYRGDQLMEWARSITVPSDVVDTLSLAKWMVNNAMKVFVTSERRNDFFLLHGITGAWSLLQVITLIGDSAIERDLVLHFTCALLSLYKAQGAPKLLQDSLQENNGYGITLRQSWDMVIHDALLKDDTHVFKLVQVCRDMDEGNTDAELTRLYMTAVSIALDYPFLFAIKITESLLNDQIDTGE